MQEGLEARFREACPPSADACTLRWMRTRSERVSVRQDVLEPVQAGEDEGAMVTVHKGGGAGYGATSDLSLDGLRRALRAAERWAELSAGRSVDGIAALAVASHEGRYRSPVEQPWGSVSLADKVALLEEASARLHAHEAIVDWVAELAFREVDSLLVTTAGGRIEQQLALLTPRLRAIANRGAETQRRTFEDHSRQGGLEVLDQVGFAQRAERLPEEALELLDAPDCPEGAMDLLLAPDQMVLQIHESIGHPLELDRILGDERNYAGTSFVTLDMLGSYRYGSELLNVTYDPTVPGQFASYGFDDDGTRAERTYLIRDGVLLRALGGAASQLRSGLGGVACARACSWNRPPIDRMANLNVEPGTSTMEDMVAAVERGVYMQTNCSWSIDDSRNKFQFGCEHGRLIEDGELRGVVKNPSYRGISATFWRSLKLVGERAAFAVMGLPNCGKGEPNQVISVGHASPPCLFASVDVFGGA